MGREAEASARACNVLRYDLRGHGQSEAPRGDYTLAQMADDLRALLDHLSIRRCHFIGLSLGAMVGQLAAIRSPLRYASLTLASAASLRGSVRLIGLDDKRSPEESVRLYRDAMKVAPKTEELKLLLSAVGEARSLAAFQLAAGYLKDEKRQNEAEIAVVKIGEGIVGTSGVAVAPVLKQVEQTSKNEAVVRRARRMLQELIRKGEYHE